MRAPDTTVISAEGAGKPLVLLHGVGADRNVWRRVVTRMRERRRLLVPDLPGFGESAPVGHGFELPAVADSLAESLGSAAGGPFDLVGNSLGGAVAVVLARRHPELVERLVLAAPAGFSPRPRLVAQPIGATAPALLTGRRVFGGPLMGNGLARRLLLWGTVAAPQELGAGEARAIVQASRHSSRIGSAVAAVLAADLIEELPRLPQPLGLIWGDRDRVVPMSTLEAIRQASPAARVRVISRAGHVPQIERPDQFVAALDALLGERTRRQKP